LKNNELKSKYRNASIISSKRVVFNIKGNDYRLIADIEYKLKIPSIKEYIEKNRIIKT
jgi:mRNA interferase HigB